MNIVEIEFQTVEVPFLPSIREYMGGQVHPITFVWIRTDEGITGLGESQGLSGELQEELRQRYEGRNLWSLHLAAQHIAVQCALYDIAGQALGVPIYKLFGGKCRDAVELAYWSPPMPVRETVDEAERAANLGFRVHKLKARPDTVVQIAEGVSKVCGADFQLRIDPNTLFGDLPTGVRLARQLSDYNIEVLEDPIPFDDDSCYRQLRAKCDLPVARHFGSPKLVYHALKAETIDAFNTSGSLETVLKNAVLAEAAQKPMWIQMIAFGSPVGTMFMAHLACTLSSCRMPLDELPHIRADDMAGEGYEIVNGAVKIPEGPGLGVSLNMQAVKKYQIN